MSVETLLVVAVGAVLAPLIVELTPRIVLPVVVVEVLLGIVAGPVLGLAEPGGFLNGLAGLGLAFLFFLAGMEIDLPRVSGRPLRLGAAGWGISLATAFVVAAALGITGVATPVHFVAAALCTTALGTLLPILRDAGVLPTRLGRHALAVGMCGELFPIVLMSVLLTSVADRSLTVVLLVTFVVVAVICALVAMRVRPARLVALLERSMHTSSQLPVRGCMLLLVTLVYLAEDFGLDVILGAFAAGMVVGLIPRPEGAPRVLESKLEAIGFGFLVPIFFIHSGLAFDLHALTSAPLALAEIPLFLAALLIVRGLPALMYRSELGARDRVALALYSSTTLPLVVAITAIATAGGHMDGQTAASLVGAAMVSVLVFPALALALRGRVTPAPVFDRGPGVPLGA